MTAERARGALAVLQDADGKFLCEVPCGYIVEQTASAHKPRRIQAQRRRRAMATIGLRDLYRAPITIGTDGAEEYGTPVRMAKAISAELSVEVAEAILYADDGADEVVKEFVSGEITLNVNDLLPADLAALLGQKQDADKVVYGADTDEAPYFAIGFRAKKAGGTYKYIWLYKVKFAVPDENY